MSALYRFFRSVFPRSEPEYIQHIRATASSANESRRRSEVALEAARQRSMSDQFLWIMDHVREGGDE